MKRELRPIGRDVAIVFKGKRIDKRVAERQFRVQVVRSGHFIWNAFDFYAVTRPTDLKMNALTFSGGRQVHFCRQGVDVPAGKT